MDTSPATTSPSDPVSDREDLLRWLLNRKQHFRANHTPPILEEAFQPRKTDDKGLSLSRRKSDLHPDFPDEWEFKARNRHPDQNLKDTCGVCAILVQAAREIGLRVDPDPIIDESTGAVIDPSHVLLPDINFGDFEGDNSTLEKRERIRTWINELIEHAKDRILIPPGTSLASRPTTPSTPNQG